jgi:hypothetical protein
MTTPPYLRINFLQSYRHFGQSATQSRNLLQISLPKLRDCAAARDDNSFGVCQWLLVEGPMFRRLVSFLLGGSI